jgi:hypothetical protein
VKALTFALLLLMPTCQDADEKFMEDCADPDNLKIEQTTTEYGLVIYRLLWPDGTVVAYSIDREVLVFRRDKIVEAARTISKKDWKESKQEVPKKKGDQS